MKLKLGLTITLFCLTLSVFAQETPQNTLENQFKDVIEESNDYQDYKVVKKTKLNTLQKNITDSISALKAEIEKLDTEIDQQKNKINDLSNNLTKTQEELAISQKKENGIEVFGILTSKGAYNTILWSIIAILLVVAGFLGFKFKNSHAVTKEAQLKLAEIEIEFEAHRQKALEQHQQVRRKLQDEINKGKKG
jgi:peptidoglycan hydrolase CwlO-like protein